MWRRIDNVKDLPGRQLMGIGGMSERFMAIVRPMAAILTLNPPVLLAAADAADVDTACSITAHGDPTRSKDTIRPELHLSVP